MKLKKLPSYFVDSIRLLGIPVQTQDTPWEMRLVVTPTVSAESLASQSRIFAECRAKPKETLSIQIRNGWSRVVDSNDCGVDDKFSQKGSYVTGAECAKGATYIETRVVRDAVNLDGTVWELPESGRGLQESLLCFDCWASKMPLHWEFAAHARFPFMEL